LRVRFFDAATGEVRETNYTMNIIRKSWKILASFSMNLECGGSSYFSLSYSAIAAHDFFIDDDMKVFSYGAQPNPIKTAPTVMGGCGGCTITSHGDVGDLVYIDPGVTFFYIGEPYFYLQGRMAVISGFPAHMFECPNGIGGTYSGPAPAQDIPLFVPTPGDGLYYPLSNASLYSGNQFSNSFVSFDGIWNSTIR
jgi:hypothetical protein